LITTNQNPEQLVRDQIDKMLLASGWLVESKKQINLAAGVGVAVREYQTDIGPADYILFVDTTLTSFDKTVDKNFQDWIFKKQAGATRYTTEQVQWLRMIKDYITNWFHVDRNDFELDPFNRQGGLGKMWQLFGEETDAIINELNESLIA